MRSIPILFFLLALVLGAFGPSCKRVTNLGFSQLDEDDGGADSSSSTDDTGSDTSTDDTDTHADGGQDDSGIRDSLTEPSNHRLLATFK